MRLTEICAFVGPTRLQRIPDHVDIFAPAALGSVSRAVERGYRVICLIDGYFGNTPSVWHKEILFALKNGVKVCGSSSMGALRAAELNTFGMVGFGWVYRNFRQGVLQDDDEVCVIHAVPELNFEPLSEAMVNIRYSLRRMRRRGYISREVEFRMTSSLKGVYFAKRDGRAIRDAFEHEFGSEGPVKFDLYERTKVDVKSLDADLMLRVVTSSPIAGERGGWAFPATSHWMYQFVVKNSDIPQLCEWHPTQPATPNEIDLDLSALVARIQVQAGACLHAGNSINFVKNPGV